MELTIAIIAGTIAAATPLIYAALGELVAERSGVLNLGIEGMMLIGAATAFALALAGYPAPAAVLGAALAGAGAALLFAILALSLLTSQYAAGLALTIFGSGLSAFIGRDFGAAPLEPVAAIALPLLYDIPLLGPALFNHDPMVYCAFILAVLIGWFLYRSKAGLIVRMLGESPQSAHRLGYRVIFIRYLTTLFGGAMAGLGGAYLALVYTPLWVENMTAGRGWIALVLVVFAGWRPFRIVLGALLFGGVNILQLHAQSLGFAVPSELLSALPYIATILVLVLISRDLQALRLNVPLSLAKPFRADE